MNSFLLDTHVWLWSLVEPGRLSERVRSVLEDEQAELYLSPISVWEAILLGEKGRVSMDSNPTDWVKKALELSPLHEAPLNHEIAICSRQLKFRHQDPADRFLLATASVFNLALITADKTLWKCPEIRCLKA